MPKSRLQGPKIDKLDTKLPHLSFAESAQRILAAIALIPSGFVASYGGIAARANLPGRARLVARALRLADDPELAWYRVIRSDGSCAVPGQAALLIAEGVQFQGKKVAPEHWHQQHIQIDTPAELDRWLWGV
jgi:methylated-DNA-protein-cysteine methyltransferase related protein